MIFSDILMNTKILIYVTKLGFLDNLGVVSAIILSEANVYKLKFPIFILLLIFLVHGDKQPSISSSGSKQNIFTVVNTQDVGSGSLAQAIIDANQLGDSLISFNIPTTDPGFVAYADDGIPGSFDPNQPVVGALSPLADPDSPSWWRIALPAPDPSMPLPPLTGDRITIDATTQAQNQGNTNPLGPEIEIIHTSSDMVGGMAVLGNYNTIKGLSVYFLGIGSDYNTVEGNYLGTNPSGQRVSHQSAPSPSALTISGLHNAIGGIEAGSGNVINGATLTGIEDAGDYNQFLFNHIGVNAAGNEVIGAGVIGITMGNYSYFRGNVVGRSFISISGTGNILEYNFIGTDSTRILAFPMNYCAIYVSGGQQTRIGPGNLIRNALGPGGICIQGLMALGNTITQNSISNSQGPGIYLFSGGNNDIPAPVVQYAFANLVTGLAMPGGAVEIFSDPDDEGLIFEGTAISSPNGVFVWSGAANGPNITATVTDGQGNSSAFSTPVPLNSNTYTVFLPLLKR